MVAARRQVYTHSNGEHDEDRQADFCEPQEDLPKGTEEAGPPVYGLG
jgi:hypothetical protein